MLEKSFVICLYVYGPVPLQKAFVYTVARNHLTHLLEGHDAFIYLNMFHFIFTFHEWHTTM